MQTEESNNAEHAIPNLEKKIEVQQALINPTPNNPPWNSWAAIGVWLASIIFILVLPNILTIPYVLAQGVNLTNSAELLQLFQSDPTVILLNVLGIIPAHIFTIVLAWMVVTRFKKFSFRQTLGWNGGGFAWWHYLLILVGFFAVAGVVGYFVPEQDNDLLRILRSSRSVVYVVAFMATFTAPVVEEVIYRGLLFSAFQRTFGVPLAVLIVTLLFALVHVPQYLPSYSTIFLICLLSLILTLIRVRTGSLLPCIILHTIFNGLQSLFLILEPFLPKMENELQKEAASIINFLM